MPVPQDLLWMIIVGDDLSQIILDGTRVAGKASESRGEGMNRDGAIEYIFVRFKFVIVPGAYQPSAVDCGDEEDFLEAFNCIDKTPPL